MSCEKYTFGAEAGSPKLCFVVKNISLTVSVLMELENEKTESLNENEIKEKKC